MPRHLVLALLLAAPPAWCQSAADRRTAAEIRRLRASSNAAIAKHDTSGFGAILAPDFSIVTSYSNHESGRDNHVRSIAQTFASRPDVVYVRTPDDVRVFAPWGMASEQGRWTGSWTDGASKVRITGSYFAKWRKVNGAWRVEGETYVPESCTGGPYCTTPPR
ncbi:MAG: nuclear transport factor 2 family protein [Gemmatimonadota bacterium]|nr:nuclear transport factor 2 family protein [Gemmatimonadota bacterium]